MAIRVSGNTVIDDSKNIQNIGIITASVINATTITGDGSGLTGAGSTVSDDISTNDSFYPIFTKTTSGTITDSKVSTTKLSFNPSSGTLESSSINSNNGDITTFSSDDANITNLNSSGISTVHIKTVSEVSSNNFNSVLSPSSGTLTIDISQSTVVLGDINSSVTTWAFTNVSTNSNRATTVTMIIDGDTSQTYGDACTVNGSSISGGVKWSNGSAPESTNNFDIISFLIIKDGAGTINVFGSANTNFS